MRVGAGRGGGVRRYTCACAAHVFVCVCVARARVCLYDKMHTFVVICKRRKRSEFLGDEAL